jgi:hypothetical protein
MEKGSCFSLLLRFWRAASNTTTRITAPTPAHERIEFHFTAILLPLVFFIVLRRAVYIPLTQA